MHFSVQKIWTKVIFVVSLYRIWKSCSKSPQSGVKHSVTQEKSPPYHPIITPKSPGNHPLYHKQKCEFVSKWYEMEHNGTQWKRPCLFYGRLSGRFPYNASRRALPACSFCSLTWYLVLGHFDILVFGTLLTWSLSHLVTLLDLLTRHGVGLLSAEDEDLSVKEHLRTLYIITLYILNAF